MIWWQSYLYNGNVYASDARIISCMGSTNERRRYIVTPPLISWAQTKNAPCDVMPAHSLAVLLTVHWTHIYLLLSNTYATHVYIALISFNSQLCGSTCWEVIKHGCLLDCAFSVYLYSSIPLKRDWLKHSTYTFHILPVKVWGVFMSSKSGVECRFWLKLNFLNQKCRLDWWRFKSEPRKDQNSTLPLMYFYISHCSAVWNTILYWAVL